MSYSTFNVVQVDTTQEPMFLGQGLSVARYDAIKHRFLDKGTDQQFSQFWLPGEVDLTKDRIEYWNKLDEGQRYIFTANLKYQSLLDSVQARAPMLAFGPLISLPELETWTTVYPAFEAIHDKTYTWIIRNVYPNPAEIFDAIVVDENIVNRAQALTRAYDELIELGMIFSVYGYGPQYVPSREETIDLTPEVLRRAIIRALCAVNCLEGIRFYVSFLCSFAFTEKLDVMAGNSKLIKFIARDENLHRKVIGDILKTMAVGGEGEEWRQSFEACREDMDDIFDETFEQEVAWADHLLSEGRSIPGLTVAGITEYLKFLTNQVRAGCGLPAMFKDARNPYPWVDKHLYSANVQVAPQEAEISSYLMGKVDSRLDLAKLNNIDI